MSKIKGRDVVLSVNSSNGYKKIAFAKSCDIMVQCDTQEFTSALSGRGKRYRAGRYSWTISVDTLIGSPDDPNRILQALITGLPVEIMMLVGPLLSGTLLSGTAIATSWKETGSLGSMATFSATFLGDGELRF